jgi:hypothetical protein
LEAFFGITLSIIVLYLWLRSATAEQDPRELRRNTVKARWDRKRINKEKLEQEAAAARKSVIEERKRKDTEELITVINPTINNDKR